jgi:hypothetical protein
VEIVEFEEELEVRGVLKKAKYKIICDLNFRKLYVPCNNFSGEIICLCSESSLNIKF